MTKIDLPNSYPVELTPPDIGPYAQGNTGVPYVWSFDSGAPGPHVMVSAVVHGNEPCGAIAVDWLLREEIRPVAGTLTLAFMNVEAYHAFDPADPNATRWVDEDFNRVWNVDVLEGERDSVELRRAREVRPVLDQVDYLFDIHSMQHKAAPLMMTGRQDKAVALAAKIGVPDRVCADAGHKAGRRMRDYGGFDNPASAKTALLIECGQHWEAGAADLAKQATARFLTHLGTVDRALLDALGEAPPPQRFFAVTEAITIETEAFRFAEPWTGGEVLSAQGTLIGHDGDKPIRSPYDNCMLVMPSMRLWPGQTAVRLAREVR